MSNFLKIIVSAILIMGVSMASAQDRQERKTNNMPIPEEPAKFVTEHQARINGENVSYTATAGEMLMRDEKTDEVTGLIWNVSYVRTDSGADDNRPVMFIFNGGPGSSSVWLHMGVFGPKRVVLDDDASDDGAAPFQLDDNPLSLLDVTDMVIIDPVGVGYSRTLGKSNGKDVWGVKEDARSVGNFIYRWLTENNRWQSPKYLAGESYGTTRAAALIGELEGGWTDVAFNGVILISSILDFNFEKTDHSHIHGYLSYLPTMAATSWYHNLIPNRPDNIEDLLGEVRDFTIDEYAPALLKGSSLSEGDRQNIIDKLHAYTGLSKEYIDQADLKVTASLYRSEVMRSQRKAVGRLDGRFIIDERAGNNRTYSYDPSSAGIDAAYTAGIMHYMRNDLGVTGIRREYNILGGIGRWNWPEGRNGTNVAPLLAQGLVENKDLRVYVTNGYYDMATPFHGTEMTFNNYGFDKSRVQMSYFEVGHMIYIHGPSLERMAREMREFVLAD